MTREEREKHLDWLYRLKSEIFVFMPKDWLIPMADALDVAIKALEQEPKTAHWIRHETDYGNGLKIPHRECSECRVWLEWDLPRNSFCPNCGANMIEPQESEDKEHIDGKV